MMMQNSAATPLIHRNEYQAPKWLVPDIALSFDLDPALTRVTARLSVKRNGGHASPLRLDGDTSLNLKSLSVDGQLLGPDNWKIEGGQLVIDIAGDNALVETVVEITPDKNTKLMGLYASGGLLCTQCEAEGFRSITYFPDRPDVLSRYTVRLEADQGAFPILLSNGNCTAKGLAGDGRHWAEWTDPFPKPSYLFALVAGDLVAARDQFTTMGGRLVELAIWVREADQGQTGHAMTALKHSMAWDEQVYGREYDLDLFNIVAVSDFNFGAMENKSLNIFNARYVLADAETATDADFDGVEAVVAHEYFHNWSGNRVTCRDWFQLSLKEGFTVYRDQCFSADHGSAAVKRIEDVRALRAVQFPEDAGPLAHPVRPESYQEISNFYTATIYNKGAELIRMMATLLGQEAFRKGSDLYFDRHDGQAVTCEDFVLAMEDASGVDLTQFRLWYEQAGTPVVQIELEYDAIRQTAKLLLKQHMAPTAGQAEKRPMHIPLKLALFGKASGKRLGDELLFELKDPEQELLLTDVTEVPILSVNRGFTAPVTVNVNQQLDDIAALSACDDDSFARYEAMQELMLRTLVAAVSGDESGFDLVVLAVQKILEDQTLDDAFVGEAVLLPSETFIAERLLLVDPDAIARARQALRKRLSSGDMAARWRERYEKAAAACAGDFSLTTESRGARRMCNVALNYIAASGADDAAALAYGQYINANNMTARQGALAALVNEEWEEGDLALADFYKRYQFNPLVIDKWFATQALSTRAHVVDQVLALSKHADFTLTNPNRLRALVGSFAANQRAFHDVSGRGYTFLSEIIRQVDRLNPQAAARLVVPLGRWKRLEPKRSAMMRTELEKLAALSDLSVDVREQVDKSLI